MQEGDQVTTKADPLLRLSREQVREIVTEAIASERATVEARFVEQEHRGTRIILNWFDLVWSEKQELRRAAWLALAWSLLPRPTTIAFFAGGLLTLLVTVLGVAMAYRANVLIERQNTRLDVQNLLSEAQRRTTFLASELAIISPLLQNERKAARERADAAKLPFDENARFDLSSGLASRVTALAAALRPYRVVEISTAPRPSAVEAAPIGWIARTYKAIDDFIDPKNDEQMFSIPAGSYSPERGQLLLQLALSGVSINAIPKINFDHTLLVGANIRGADLSGVDLSNSYFRDVNFHDVKLARTQLQGALFESTNFLSSTFMFPVMGNTVFRNVALHQSEIQFSYPENKNNLCSFGGSLATAFHDSVLTSLFYCDVTTITFSINDGLDGPLASRIGLLLDGFRTQLGKSYIACAMPIGTMFLRAHLAEIQKSDQPCRSGFTLLNAQK